MPLRRQPTRGLRRYVRMVFIVLFLATVALVLTFYVRDFRDRNLTDSETAIEPDAEAADNDARHAASDFQPADPSQVVIGYAGCSITHQTVEGYWRAGGRNMWPPEQRYDDGSVMNWGNPRMPFQQVFAENLKKYPATKIIWWQLCLPSHEFPAYDHANEVITAIKARAPHATIYVSSLAPYEHLCEASGATGVARGQALAE